MSKTLRQSILLACVVTLSLAVARPAAALTAAPATGTILDTLNDLDRFQGSEDSNGLDRFRFSQFNWYDFDILTAAVVADGSLVPAVTDPASALTLFAPNDRAFQLLAYDLTGTWLRTEAQVLDAILGAVQAGAVDLTKVLTHHVLGSRVDRANVPFNTPVTTLNGDTIEFRRRLFGFVQVRDNVSAFRNPFLLRTDLDAGSSVVHSITRVLIPVDFAG